MDKPANRFYGEQRVEIKPGEYGKISVSHFDDISNTVWINVRDDFGHVDFNADELREAAYLFVQLAEYLEQSK